MPYFPDRISLFGSDRLRFELGDTSEREELSDCEYQAVLARFPNPQAAWNKILLICADAILAKYASQCDTTIGSLSYRLSQRYDHWKSVREQLSEYSSNSTSHLPLLPRSSLLLPHYFNAGLHDNPSASPLKNVRPCPFSLFL